MLPGYILALDLGTTGNRAFVFDADGKIVANAYKELTQYYPKPGWLEHNALEIWSDTCWVIQTAIAKAQILSSQIAAIVLTVQRETCLSTVYLNQGKNAVTSQFGKKLFNVPSIGQSDIPIPKKIS